MKKIKRVINSIFQLLFLFDKPFRYRFIVCFILASILAFLEVISLASLVPLISVVSGSGEAHLSFLNNRLVTPFFNSIDNYVLFFTVVLLALFLIKNLFSVFTFWFMSKTLFAIKNYTAYNLLKLHLYRPYIDVIADGTGEFQKNTIIESQEVITRAFIPIMYIFIEILIISGIGLLLLLINPIATLVAISIFTIFTILFTYFTSRISIKWGKYRAAADSKRLQLSNEIFNILQELKISGKEELFLNEYFKEMNQAVEFEGKQFFLSQTPKSFLETTAVFTFAAAIIYFSLLNSIPEGIIELIALSTFAAFRLLPSFNRLIVSANNISYGKNVIELIGNKFSNLKSLQIIDFNEKISIENNITLRKVTFCYPRNQNNGILIPLMIIRKNSFVGIVGESGSGKTTILNIIAGLLKPDNGYFSIDGKIVDNKNLKALQNSIGFIPQTPFFLNNSILKNISMEMDSAKINLGRALKCAEMTGLNKLLNDLPDGIQTSIGENGKTLSGGQKQRLAIARALYNDPEILIFDEIMGSLDVKSKERMISLINSFKGTKTIILVTHDYSEIAKADQIFKMEGGVLEEMAY